MAMAYLDPNLNHALLGGAKSRLSAGGSDRTMAVGTMDRVLKVFHYFESNSEHSCWSSNIRYGDATDVRVRRHTFSLCKCTLYGDTLPLNALPTSSNYSLKN